MSLVFSREVGFRDRYDHHALQGLSTFSELHARRLVVDEVLQGHDGCVNRLAWNEHGTRLASGSDDCRIILWRYPSGGQAPLGVFTSHTANLFGVEFLPGSDDRLLVSGAMDCTVQLHELDGVHPPRPPAAAAGSSPRGSRQHAGEGNGARIPFVQPRTTVFRCHSDRVKDMAVQAGEPHLFWSAAEDGTVRQFDRRVRGQTEPSSANALLRLVDAGLRTIPCKGVNICAARPHLLALACGDPWVRVFDRRRLGPVSLGMADGQSQPLLKLCPPHLMPAPDGANLRLAPRCHTTCASFSSRGDRLVATYYADHAYIFDITSAGTTHAALPTSSSTGWTQMRRPAASHRQQSQQLGAGEQGDGEREAGPERPEFELCRRIRQVTAQLAGWHGLSMEERGQEGPAAQQQQLLLERSRALLLRGWRGDAAWAVRDLEACLDAEPDGCEARRLLVEALEACGQPACAAEAAKDWLERCPGAAGADDVLERLQGLRRLLHRRQASLREAGVAVPERGAARAAGAAAEQSSSAEPDDSWWRARAMDPWWPFYHRSAAAVPEPTDPSGASPSSSSSSSSSSGHVQTRFQRDSSVSPGGPLGRGSVWRDTQGGLRVVRRLIGQQNLHTDIKEAAFLGPADALVAAGSDDGHVFIYCTETGELLVALKADDDVANCCKPHPHHPVLATSGIEDVVRLWAPSGAGEECPGGATGRELERLVALNQQALRDGGGGHGFGAVLQQHSDLVRVVLRGLAAAGQARQEAGAGAGAEGEDAEEVEYPCRVS